MSEFARTGSWRGIATSKLGSGLPDAVARAWGYPILVTTETWLEQCDCCSECGGHERWRRLDEADWYWRPSVADMSLLVNELEAQPSALFTMLSKLGK